MQALRDIVVVIMIEKQGTVDQLEEVLSVPGVDMVQWGPSDYAMNVGRAGQGQSPEIKAVERRVFETALKMGVPPRVELGSLDQAQYYLDMGVRHYMGVRHFCIGTDITILYDWWKTNGERMRKVINES